VKILTPTLGHIVIALNGFLQNFSPIFDHHISLNVNQNSIVIIASSYRLDSLGIESLLGQEIFSFLKPSRLSLGPIQCAVQWVAVFFHRGTVAGA
jgi:hypothetical protein